MFACGFDLLVFLMSSPPLSKDRFREQCAAEKISKGAAFGRHTAGTTGAPTNVALGRKDLSRMLAVRDYCLRHYGIKLGEREARVWGRPDKGWKGMIRNLVLNRSVFYPRRVILLRVLPTRLIVRGDTCLFAMMCCVIQCMYYYCVCVTMMINN